MLKVKDKRFARYIRSFLFSSDFLENHLNDLEDFQALDNILLKAKFQEVCNYYKEELKTLSEAQLEENFLRPIFKSLGHIYEVQTAKKSEDTDEGTKLIDYAFFYTEEDKEIFHKNKNERNAIKFATCSTICEAKVWGLLKGYDQVKKNDNSDPIWQIKKSYLDNINPKEQKAKVPFGILTDGKYWRIYSYRSEIDKFFEIDLEEIIKSKDLDQFKVFWFFFSKEAFRGKSYLTSIESGSKKLQSEVSEDLRKQVYLSLELIATGLFRVYNSGKRDWEEFKKYPEIRSYLEEHSLAEIDISHPGTEKVILDIIYTESLVYLFRILFLLYADHRNLFKHNKVQSIFYQLLDKIDSYNQIGNIPEDAENISDKNDDYDINGVFEEIDHEFNGGLFSIKSHTILNRFDIDNILYANAIDYLTRTFDKKTQKPQRVDFSVLEVRHLGTIYEGLLEYKLTKATEDITIPLLSDKKKTRKLKCGDLYLVNDKGERKASGSYYTPDYIVESIVKFTVGPLIDNIEKESTSLKEKIPKILALRILDPAMGSGHFLVEVINYMNDRIEALIQDEIEEYASKPGRKTKTQIELEALLKEAENGLYKRIIAKRCIYGVDKNPMAVELAKLSIWIYTLQRNRKLEFFDYNLRCGDSLIGSQEKTFSSQLHSKTKERLLFADNEELYKNVVEDFKEEFKKYFELESVEERMKYYESVIKPNQQKLKYLANIELALAFADKNDEIQSIYNANKNNLLGIIRMDKSNEYIRKLVKGNDLEKWEVKLFNAAKKVRDDYNPIHWELDFPNVFIDKGGFDGVVGNPPYVSNWTLSNSDREMVKILENMYSDWLTGHWDLFICFIAKSIQILNEKSYHSFILPTSLLKEKHSTKVREKILLEHQIIEIIDFGEDVIFDSVARQTFLYLIGKEFKSKNRIKIKKGLLGEPIKIEQEFFSNLKNSVLKTNITTTANRIFEKMRKESYLLGELVCINTGVVAHSKEESKKKFKKDDVIFKENKKGFKKYIIGEDLKRYRAVFMDTYLDYENNVDYFHRPKYRLLFESPKIIVRRISGANNTIIAYYDEEKFYSNDNLMHLIKWSKDVLSFQKPEKKWEIIVNSDINLKYILTILCSSLSRYFFSNFLSTDTLQGSYSSIYPEDLRVIPIKKIPNQQPFIQKADIMLSENKELQEIQKKFTKLLQSDFKIEKLSEKLEEWNRLSFDDFLGELKKKKIELKLDKKAEWMDYFEKEKEKANAIQEVISKTDSEIDAMVYKLYGLTEDEIRIVEGGV
jgi:type I restriction-modification system DNA methylase subunit